MLILKVIGEGEEEEEEGERRVVLYSSASSQHSWEGHVRTEDISQPMRSKDMLS